MLSVILEINKDFFLDKNISPEAKGIYLFLAYRKNSMNTVEIDSDLISAVLEMEDNFILKAINELVEKKYISVEFNTKDDINIHLINNEDIKKFTFGLN